MTTAPTSGAAPAVWRHGVRVADGRREIPEETALAITFQRETYAVMMGTPADLEDFALGFALTEGIVARAADIVALEVLQHAQGIELRMDLAGPRLAALTARRRRLAGPTGCGLCGIDSLAEAVRLPRAVPPGGRVTAGAITQALRAIEPLQALNQRTRAVHGAALWLPERGVVALREDVGRHNALDKLVGAAARAELAAGDGMLLLTSRVSIEMVQKAARLGTPVVVAVSAPTAHAVRLAEAAGITLVAIARADGFEVFCGAERIATESGPMSPDEKLVYMANQIGKFFAAQGEERAVQEIASHLRRFWDPRMRTAIIAHLRAGAAGLDPLPRRAVERLASES